LIYIKPLGQAHRTLGAGLSVKDARGDAYAMLFERPIAEADVGKRYYPLRMTSPATGETTLALWTAGAWSPLNSVSQIDAKTGRTIDGFFDRINRT
jgi:hypothetical protein